MQTLDWLASGNNYTKLEKLCNRISIVTHENADDMIGRAIDLLIEHGDHWTERYDTTKQITLDTWLLVCVGFKLRTRKIEKFEILTDQIPDKPLYSNGEACEPDPAPDILSENLERLNGYDRWLIVSRHVHKINFTTIADALGVSKGTVRTHYLRAIERCRNLP